MIEVPDPDPGQPALPPRLIRLGHLAEASIPGPGSEPRLHQVLLDALRQGVALFDAGGRLVAANRLTATLGGFAVDLLRPGQPLALLLQAQAAAGEFGAAAEARLAEALAQDRSKPLRHIRTRPCGMVVEVTSDPVPGGGFVITVSDITARTEAEAAVGHQAATLRATLDNLQHGVIVYGPDRRLVESNALAAALSGMPPGSLRPGRSFDAMARELMANGELPTPEAQRLAEAALTADRSRSHAYLRTRPDGTMVEVRSEPTPDGGFIVTHIDVTRLARAEAEARHRAALLQTMQDHIHHGIAQYGPDRRLLAVNRLAGRLSGAPESSLTVGARFEDIVAGQAANGTFGTRAAAEAEVARILAFDRRQPIRYQRTTPDGTVIEVRSEPTPDGGFVNTFTDITALAQAEAAASRRARLLQTMQDTMRHGIALFGSDQRLMIANSLAAGLAGMPPEELRPGLTPADIAGFQMRHGVFDDTPDPAATAAEVGRRDRRLSHGMRRRMPDGRVVDSVSDPTPDGGFVITWTDVTALVRAEAAAERQAEIQATMLATIRHGIALYGPDHRLIAVNRQTNPLDGPAVEQIGPGATYAEVVRHQAALGGLGPPPEAAAEMARLLSLDRSRPHRYLRHLADGRLIEVHSDPTPDGGFAVTFSDITALATAEAAAASRAAVLQAALDTMRHGIVLFGPDDRLLAANTLATAIGGLSAEELRPGILALEQIRMQHARGMYGTGAAADATLAQLLGVDRRQPWRRTRHMPDGRVVEVFSDPTPDGGWVVTFTDITAQALAEAAARHRAQTLQLTMDNIRHGILMFGPDRRLLVANRLAGPSLGLPDLQGRAGAVFEDLVCEQRLAGVFGPDPEGARVAAELIGLDRSRPARFQRRLPDQRMIDIGSDPTPDGGFIITCSDVTDLETAKAEASNRAAVLQVMLDNLRHGIRYFGPDQRLVAYNKLVDELTGTSALTIAVGISYEDLLQRQALQGIFGDAATTAEVVRMAHALNRGVPARYVRRTPAGRILEIVSNPTPNGGFIVSHADVTDLLEAQAVATDRARLLQLMMDSMRHGIALFDRDHRLVAANALAAEFNGLAIEQLRPGQTHAELANEVVAAGIVSRAAADAALAEDYRKPQRRSRHRPDGRVIEIVADPTPDGGFVATYSDITALTQAEAAARERTGILEVMLDNIRHGICYYGPDRRVIAANTLAGSFGGHPPGTLRPGRLLDELIEEQLALRVLSGDGEATARMALAMDRSRPARYNRATPDGRILEVTSDPTPDGGFVVASADITALAHAEQEAQRRAAILQAMLENSRQGIILFDATGVVMAANSIAAALNGLPPEAVRAGRRIEQLIEDQAARGYLDAASRAEALALVPDDRPWPVPYTRRRILGEGRIIEIVTDRAGETGYIRSYRDISEEQRARTELERARDAAEAANQAKSRFLATMSHELRTPLNAVIGFSEAFMADRDPVRGREYVQSIHEAGRHLLSLIDDILDVTRSETTGFAITEGRVDIATLAEGAVRVMQATAAAARVTLQARVPAILPLVRADELRLRQVLLNLLANAVKFTPAGGSVTLDAALEPAQDKAGGPPGDKAGGPPGDKVGGPPGDKASRPKGQHGGGDLVPRVADTGIGMAAADIPRAFEAFTQLDSSLSRRFPGSGLGLYLSRALAEAQGATLTLESTPGAGTTAVLRIPKTRLLPHPA
ncbi:MAG: hypothetical protein JWP04_85 [Belnapia sp.]|nr:hypothetical protein [Belnapia sp.]